MADPAPANTTASPRRKRRWLRRILLGLLVVLVLLWIVKVPVTLWFLRRLPGDWEISVTGLRPGITSLTLRGVRVVHRPTGRPLGYAQEVEVSNGWPALIKGKLGKLTLTKAEVSWRDEF